MRTYLTVGGYRAGEQSVLAEPYLDLTAATAKRGIVMCHGYGADATAVYSSGYDMPALLGNHLLAIDGGANKGIAAWGNDDSVTALGLAVTYLQAIQGVKTDKIILIGISMGALTVLNWTRQNLTKVAALGLVIPCLDLQYLHDTAPTQSQNGVTVTSVYPNLKTDIEASWGGGATPPANYYSTHSPLLYGSQLASIPMTMWISNNDVVTNSPAAPGSFSSAVGPNSAIVNCGTQTGLGHNAPCATLPAVAGYLQNYI